MIQLSKVHYQVGQFVLRDLELEVPHGQYAVLMGQTGQGKTSILEIICGLRPVKSGRVLVGGRDVTEWAPGDREVGYVPQDLVLFSHLNVRENLEFALRLRRYPAAVIDARVGELAEALDISHLLHRSPEGLSGGERQRVAVGRAIAFWPSVLLLDEPLSALDSATRREMRTLLRSLREASGATILHVTHDPEEARALADHIYVLVDGVIH